MYENFNAPSTESLDSISNRLQKIVSQLPIIVLMKLILLIFKLVLSAHQLVILVDLSDATIYTFLANQPNGSQLVHKDLEQIHMDDLEEMDMKWQLALLSMRAKRFFQKIGKKININGSDTAGYDKTKVECFNYHKMGHFSRKSMIGIDGAGFDWSYMADNKSPTNMAFMVFSDLELEKISKEKEAIDFKIEKFGNASQSLDKLIRRQITNNSKRGLGYESYNAFPPPHTGSYGVKPIEVVTQTSSIKISKSIKRNNDAPLIEDWELDGEDEVESPSKIEKKTVEPSVDKGHSHKQLEDQGYFDSRCSKHMTENISYLTDFQEFDRGYVTFGGGAKGVLPRQSTAEELTLSRLSTAEDLVLPER
ncbi:hypothetical protein Tco_1025479 [Tanacetum coccineum]